MFGQEGKGGTPLRFMWGRWGEIKGKQGMVDRGGLVLEIGRERRLRAFCEIWGEGRAFRKLDLVAVAVRTLAIWNE